MTTNFTKFTQDVNDYQLHKNHERYLIMTTNFIKFTQNIQKLLSTSQKSYLKFNNDYQLYKIHAGC